MPVGPKPDNGHPGSGPAANSEQAAEGFGTHPATWTRGR
ncbi:hypothetical protein J2853_000232 [Streptosporangium lutulentum]|uniref:Uncharacterized protein n=1 Tax=Streptosporangium lutulentum TaxID=1461250 RepID=A0ABT9Q2S0_9ACTN|nr:hypothetical protein [Streptosporangium lutulentum]